LTHPSAPSQGTVELGILHERKVGELTRLPERRTPAKNPMIAEGEAKYFDAYIAK
jgi:hypothetical protein